jgi:predicted RNA methylase
MAFDVQNMYKFHTQKSKDIEVDLIRIAIENGEDA